MADLCLGKKTYQREADTMGLIDVQKAIKDSIQTEKDAMDFYKYGAERMMEDKARQTFEILAREEYQHAESFYRIYPGDDIPSFQEFMSAPPNTESDWWKGLQNLLMQDFDERKALELAIEQEDALEKYSFTGLKEYAEKGLRCAGHVWLDHGGNLNPGTMSD